MNGDTCQMPAEQSNPRIVAVEERMADKLAIVGGKDAWIPAIGERVLVCAAEGPSILAEFEGINPLFPWLGTVLLLEGSATGKHTSAPIDSLKPEDAR